MIARKSLVLGLLLAASALALPAENAKTLLSHGRSSLFQIDVPGTWEVQWTAGSKKPQKGQRQVKVFELTLPTSSGEISSRGEYASISGYYYTDMVPLVARLRWEGSAPGPSTELPRMAELPAWTLVETSSTRTLTAYTQFGSDVLYMNLSAPNAELYSQGKRDLIEMLKSYKEQVAGSP